MLHCPQCGSPAAADAQACSVCGAALPREQAPARAGGPAPSARTIVGLSAADVLAAAARGPAPSQLHHTIVGGVAPTPAATPAPTPAPASAEAAPAARAPAPNRTMMGVAPPVLPAAPGAPSPNRTIVGGIGPVFAAGAEAPAPDPHATAVGPGTPAHPGEIVAPPPQARTMIGVAMPGIAPLNPGVAPEPHGAGRADAHPGGDAQPGGEPARPDPYGYRPAGELGATVGPEPAAWRPGAAADAALARQLRRPEPNRERLPLRAAPPKPPTRAIVVVGAGLGLALIAVLVAVFWRSAPPITARAKVDAEGREVVEVRCPSCPDGTRITTGGATATIAGQLADVPVTTPLSIGENLLKVAIDRPDKGRDETVSAQINIAYRIRPDLTTLQGERPSIQIVIEAVTGTVIALDGKPVTLNAGRAIETLDVSEPCTGLADEPATLSRQIPYTVTLAGGGAPEQGTIQVSVGILPLHIDAPGPHAVIDGKSFVLSGRTSKGAEVLAAGRAIPVRADGTFAQTMNVSSVGATQIEVRAKTAGKAPRLTRIAVKRVDSLETAAAEFNADKPLGYAAVAADIAGSVGKPAVFAGEVIEARRLTQIHQTIILLSVAKSSGCAAGGADDACQVRLVQGADSAVKRGDLLTAYGHVTRAFAVKNKPDIPEVEVDFTLKGIR